MADQTTTTDTPQRPTVDEYKGSVTGFARALTDYAASEGLGTNDPITYGDIRHVAEQLENGRNPDSTEPSDEEDQGDAGKTKGKKK